MKMQIADPTMRQREGQTNQSHMNLNAQIIHHLDLSHWQTRYAMYIWNLFRVETNYLEGPLNPYKRLVVKSSIALPKSIMRLADQHKPKSNISMAHNDALHIQVSLLNLSPSTIGLELNIKWCSSTRKDKSIAARKFHRNEVPSLQCPLLKSGRCQMSK